MFAKGAARAGDETWVARYLLERIAEKYGYSINWHPKPLGDTDWNGSGMHANFSNGLMRTSGKEDTFTRVCEEFAKNIERHISVYGADNRQRLTGAHETQAIDQFSFGVSDRGASIRIPIGTLEDGWKGRLEDRRPASKRRSVQGCGCDCEDDEGSRGLSPRCHSLTKTGPHCGPVFRSGAVPRRPRSTSPAALGRAGSLSGCVSRDPSRCIACRSVPGAEALCTWRSRRASRVCRSARS